MPSVLANSVRTTWFRVKSLLAKMPLIWPPKKAYAKKIRDTITSGIPIARRVSSNTSSTRTIPTIVSMVVIKPKLRAIRSQEKNR